MPKRSSAKNVKIENTFAEVGKRVEPLTDDEYTKLDKLYKRIKDPTIVSKFDDESDIIIAKLPDTLAPKERIMPGGETMWSIGVQLHDNSWTNFLCNSEEKEGFDGYYGNPVAIVGKLVTEEGKKGTKNEGKEFVNIKGYRGSLILAPEEEVDELDI